MPIFFRPLMNITHRLLRSFRAFLVASAIGLQSLAAAEPRTADVLVYGATPAGVCAAVGAARAINQQRAADTLTNLVAADDIGRVSAQRVVFVAGCSMNSKLVPNRGKMKLLQKQVCCNNII